MRVSASLFVSDKPLEYAKKLKEAGTDYFHLDFVEKENELMKFETINEFDKLKVPLDVHFVCSDVSKETIDKLNNSNTEILSVQYENLIDVNKTIENLKRFKKGFGLAITPKTNIELIAPYKNYITHILLMCSTPGVSGSKFSENSFEYLRQIKLQFGNIPIYADGGINYEICHAMSENGVLISVFGSYLYKNIDGLQQAIEALK